MLLLFTIGKTRGERNQFLQAERIRLCKIRKDINENCLQKENETVELSIVDNSAAVNPTSVTSLAGESSAVKGSVETVETVETTDENVADQHDKKYEQVINR